MRLFVALELPDAWRDAALALRSALEARLDSEAVRALRWVQPELMHLTLRFLGEFPDAEVDGLAATLDRYLEAFELELSLAGVERFGPPHRTQVLWLGVGGDLEGLRTLAGSVERVCVEAGAAPEPRAFRPHITLARVRERTSAELRRAVAQAAEALAPAAPTAFRVYEVALVRSILGGGAPRYEVLSRHGGGLRSLRGHGTPVDSEGGRNVDGTDRPA